MKWEDIINANKTFNLTDISGKDYVKVNQRVKGYRMLMPEGTIETEIIKWENGTIIIKATVKDETGKILATGMDCEKEGSSYINKNSYVENCETSAVGRALGFIGLGIDTEMASADEMEIALEKERQDKEKKSSTKPKEDAVQNPADNEKLGEARVCATCGNLILPAKKKDGSGLMTSSEVAALSYEKFGEYRCAECMKKGKK